jgi:hypothetical protein
VYSSVRSWLPMLPKADRDPGALVARFTEDVAYIREVA